MTPLVTRLLTLILFAALFAALSPQAAQAEVLTPGFTYQGRVMKNGSPVNGLCDLRFTLYDARSGGTQSGAAITTTSVNVVNGLFSVLINNNNEFGAQAFNSQRRWISVAVRHPAGSGNYTTLLPRQELSATPYALGLIGGAVVRNDGPSGAGLTVESLNGEGLSAASNKNTKAALLAQNKGGGHGVQGQTTSAAASATAGVAGINSGAGAGVRGVSTGGTGIEGISNSLTGGFGVYGHSVNQIGVAGESTNQIGVMATSLNAAGVSGTSTNAAGVSGTSTFSHGVLGKTANAGAYGLYGENTAGGGGVYGTANNAPDSAKAGVVGNNDGAGIGVAGQSQSGYGVMGINYGANSPNAAGILGTADNNHGVFGSSAAEAGVFGTSTDSYGVYGTTANAGGKSAVFGNHTAANGRGVMGQGTVGGVGALGLSGSASPVASLSYTAGIGVWGDSSAGPGVVGTSTNGPGVYAQALGSGQPALRVAAHGGGYLIDGGRFYFSNFGYLVCGKVTVRPMDLAEYIPVSQGKPQPGDVVEIDPDNANNFRLAAAANSTRVAGVISTEPGLTLGATTEEADQGKPQLALAGRVPVKVFAEGGPISPGDLLAASSTPGRAMRAPANPAPGTIIGKALEPLASTMGTINMLVMLR